MACQNCDQQKSINTAAVSFDVLRAMGLSEDDAGYLVDLGVRASAEDDRVSVLTVALVAASERAKALEKELEQRSVDLENAEAELEELETNFNQLTDALEGVHSPVEFSQEPQDDDGDE